MAMHHGSCHKVAFAWIQTERQRQKQKIKKKYYACMSSSITLPFLINICS
jgi:hypothetical protein